MNKLMTAIALTIALPAAALAQAAPTPAPKMDCCEKMKAAGKDCAKDMAKMDHSKHDMKAGADAHAGHDMSQMSAKAPAPAPAASAHQNH
ncbi:MAG: hypothetical protein V4696_01135 [Pseudomonadota bacterium]